MYQNDPEIMEEERELLRLLDEGLEIPPLPPDFRSNILAQLSMPSNLLSSEMNTEPESTEPELTEEERELLRLLDDEDLGIPPLPSDFINNMLARLGIPFDVPLSERPPEPESTDPETPEELLQ